MSSPANGGGMHPAPVHGLPTSTSVACVAVSIVFSVLAIITVSFRFYAQRFSKDGVTADDWAFGGAVLAVIGHSICTIYAAYKAGLGWPLQSLAPVKGELLKVVFACELFWGTAVVLVRIGLLLFYRRLFSVHWFRRVSAVVLVINIAWYLSFIGTQFGIVRWENQAHSKVPGYLIAQSTIDVVFDVITLCLPITVIGTLHMELRRKIMISGVFALGFFCLATSIVRLKYFVDLQRKVNDPVRYIYVMYQNWIWSEIQPAVSLITACIPGFPAAFGQERPLRRLMSRTKSIFSSSSNSSVHNPSNSGSISKEVGWSVTVADHDSSMSTRDSDLEKSYPGSQTQVHAQV